MLWFFKVVVAVIVQPLFFNVSQDTFCIFSFLSLCIFYNTSFCTRFGDVGGLQRDCSPIQGLEAERNKWNSMFLPVLMEVTTCSISDIFCFTQV